MDILLAVVVAFLLIDRYERGRKSRGYAARHPDFISRLVKRQWGE